MQNGNSGVEDEGQSIDNLTAEDYDEARGIINEHDDKDGGYGCVEDGGHPPNSLVIGDYYERG